jgi:hypothetical protein
MKKIKNVIKFTSLDFALDMIKNKYIFFSNPLTFNDPLDSYFIQFLLKKQKGERRNLGSFLKIAEKKFIFCGTKEENIENVLMWAHYGDFHKGIVLKYKVPDKCLGRFEEVTYDGIKHIDFIEATGERNFFKIPTNKTPEEIEDLVTKSAFSKDKEWKYEEEIRYLKNFEKNELTTENGWDVESIYLGSEYLSNSNDNLEKIIDIVEFCSAERIPVFRMKYSFCDETERFELKKMEWMRGEQLDYPNKNNVFAIKDAIISELKNRLENSYSGQALEKYIKEIAEKVVSERFLKESNK